MPGSPETSLATCAMAAEPHQPVSPNTLTQVEPEPGGGTDEFGGSGGPLPAGGTSLAEPVEFDRVAT
jgi:hypothetical protein